MYKIHTQLITLLLGLTLTYIQFSFASDQAEWQISGSILNFGYKELDLNKKLLDREDGFIPGIKLGVRYPIKQWVLAGDLAYHTGDAAYTGQTQTGIPITTTTNQRIADTTLQAEYWTQTEEGTAYAPYLGGGFHYWRRDIKPTTISSGAPVRGLLEIYTWWQIFLGVKSEIYQSETISWQLDTHLSYLIQPSIYVDFNGLYDNATLPLGERWGLKVALPGHYKLNPTADLLIEPFAETYELGRSSTATLTSNGTPVGSVNEPYSQTINYGVSLGVSQKF